MAHLSHRAVADLRQAVREGRSAFVVGPARSGTTWLMNQTTALGVEPVVRLSLAGVRELQHLRAALSTAFGFRQISPVASDFQLAIAGIEGDRRPALVVVNDCHRTTGDCLSWLLQAALEPLAGAERTAAPFLFEGAFDPDSSMVSAFPDGHLLQPIVHYTESFVPWRSLAEVEEITRERWRPSFSAALIPWLADASGGDVGLVLEILERLPTDGEIDDKTSWRR